MSELPGKPLQLRPGCLRAQRRAHLWHTSLLLRVDQADPAGRAGRVLAGVLMLHKPVATYYEPECRGCDSDGAETEPPLWPCRTVETIAGQLGCPLARRCPDCADTRPPEVLVEVWPDGSFVAHNHFWPRNTECCPGSGRRVTDTAAGRAAMQAVPAEQDDAIVRTLLVDDRFVKAESDGLD